MTSLHVASPVCSPWHALYYNLSLNVHHLAWALYSQGIRDLAVCSLLPDIVWHVDSTQNNFPINDVVYRYIIVD